MPNAYAKTNQQLTVPEHFYRPLGSSRWHVRLVAPKHVQPLVAKKEFRKSTGHSDLKRAKPIGLALLADKTREWDTLARSAGADTHSPAPTVLNAELVDHICAARLHSWMRSDDEDRFSPEGLSIEALADIDSFCKLSDAVMRSVITQGAASPHWREVIEATMDWCGVLGYAVETSDPTFIRLVREFASVEKKAQRLIALRNAGEDAATPPAPLGTVTHVLSEVTEPFREHKAVRSGGKHLGTTLNAWKLFIEHCGDIPLNSVTTTLVFGFMEARLHASSKAWSEGRAKTFGKRSLAEIFGFARTKGLMSAENPVDAMEAFPSLTAAEEASRLNPRFPYTTKQLNTLLASAWYDPTNTADFRGKMRDDLGARYWVPLFGIFHGTRVREALQLVAADFAFEDDVYVLSVRPELDEDTDKANELRGLRSVKTAATKRRFPVHPQLLALGFVEFVAERQKQAGASALLFPSSMPEPGGKSPKLGRSYEQAFLRFVRDRLALGPGLGSHGLRHQLEDRLRSAQARNGSWPPGMGQQYTGRTRTREADSKVLLEEGSEGLYGLGYTPEDMLPYIASIDFAGLSLPPAFAVWRKAAAKPRV